MQKKRNYLLEGGPLVVQAAPLGECSRNPSVSVHQLVLLWEAAFGFGEFFWRLFSTPLLISWWVVYKSTCLHQAECSAVFEQKQHDPCASLSLFTKFCPEWHFLSPDENVLKGKHFANVEEKKQKTAEALKSMKINKFKKCFELWKKHLDRCIACNGE